MDIDGPRGDVPDFAIVGAPRSGTTAMARYLAQHPAICFADPKEPHHFGSDLRIATPFRDTELYRSLFAEAGSRLTGEGSVFYLLSTRAASEIQRANPRCRIVAMLRHPVDVMYSLYWNNLRDGRHEDLNRFESALQAEASRERGIGVPSTCTWPDALRYRAVVQYATQLERYFAVFPRDQVHIIIYDRFSQNVDQEYERVLRFLGLERPRQVPDFRVVNPSRTSRSELLRDVRAGRRFSFLRRTAGRVLGANAKVALSRLVRKLNTKLEDRPPLTAELRESLTRELEPSVRDLETLLDESLEEWLPHHEP